MAAERKSNTTPGASGFEFVIAREFDAPRDLMFKLWTEREHLMRWWGPKGCEIVSCKNDLRVGGVMHYAMRWTEGMVMWGRWIYREIVKPAKLVFLNSFSDEHEGLTVHPMAPDWPRETLSTITFEERAGKTLVTVKWQPWDATEKEKKTFADRRDSMHEGWTGTLDRLEVYLPGAVKSGAR